MIYWAKVTTQFEGLHCYPDAPEAVSFLRSMHRHIFHVTVWIQQFHEERDVEYILCKRWLEDLIRHTTFVDSSSCEHIAVVIGTSAQEEFHRAVKVEVTEDGENGALVEFP